MSEKNKPTVTSGAFPPDRPAHTVETPQAKPEGPPPVPSIAPDPDAPPAQSLDEKLGLVLPADTPPEPKGPQDVAALGVETTRLDDIKGYPRRIRVWEGQHSADAAIVKNNDDDTFDLSADIWHTGQPITLIGVKRRVGLGNGWEAIDDVAEAKAQATTPHDEREGTTAVKVALDMVTLRILPAFNGELKIGNSTYQVTGGVVTVPPWHADDARAAGYQG